MLIESVFNKDQNHYYYEILLEKCSHQLAIKWSQNFFDSIIMLRIGEIKVWNIMESMEIMEY